MNGPASATASLLFGVAIASVPLVGYGASPTAWMASGPRVPTPSSDRRQLSVFSGISVARPAIEPRLEDGVLTDRQAAEGPAARANYKDPLSASEFDKDDSHVRSAGS